MTTTADPRSLGPRSGRVSHAPAHPLIAAPFDVQVPPHETWRLGADDLVARCPRCYDHAVVAGRRARELRAAAALNADVLPFDLGGAA